jgi:DNA-binding response OmpR family regulator
VLRAEKQALFTIDRVTRRITVRGLTVALSAKEYELLVKLVKATCSFGFIRPSPVLLDSAV